MAKAIIFDLDGVLVDSKEIHFNSLNLALSEVDKRFVISKAEQDGIFEGLTTKSKLKILTQTRGLSEELHQKIWLSKQKYSSAMFSSISVDTELVSLFKIIKMSDIKIAVASNSIRSTVDNCLSALGVLDYADYTISNEEVIEPKPNPEIYIKCFSHFGITSADAVVFEDSQIGIAAANSSKAKVVIVSSRKDLTFDKVVNSINYLLGEKHV
jgi:HAD superfamily hydrolase (TIGR01509 family)